MPRQVAHHLSAACGVTDVNRVLQIEVGGDGGQVVGVVVHVVTLGRLRGSPVTAPVMCDDTVVASHEEHHLRVPVVRRQGPAMAEHDGLSLAPVFVEDLHAILGR
jgi:hypothetical protein